MLTFLHPLVDFCSVAVLAAGGITFERWLAYNALAFALQLPLGVALAAALLAGGVWLLFRGSDLPSRLSSPVLTRLFIRQPWVCRLSA